MRFHVALELFFKKVIKLISVATSTIIAAIGNARQICPQLSGCIFRFTCLDARHSRHPFVRRVYASAERSR